MFTQYLRYSYPFIIIFSYSTDLYAKAYKWVDENNITHYSQQAPLHRTEFEVIAPPPPPSVKPEIAQKEIDALTEKFKTASEEEKKEQEKIKKEKEAEQKKQEYCTAIRHNLIQYQNNPGRRMMVKNGDIIPPNEEHRQQQIASLKQQIKEKC